MEKLNDELRNQNNLLLFVFYSTILDIDANQYFYI